MQTHGAKEGIWLRNFINKIKGKMNQPVTMCCDNQGAIVLAKDNKFQSRTKHINLWYHFIHKAVEDKNIFVKYIPTDKNIADIFTKSLARPKFEVFMEKLGLKENKREIGADYK